MVGTWKNGFIVLHDGQPRAVGKSEAQHNLLPIAARLIEGESLRVVAERVAMSGHTLRWLVSRIDQSRPYYLLGEVEIPDGKGPALAGTAINIAAECMGWLGGQGLSLIF